MWYQLTWVVPEKGSLNVCVRVCVCWANVCYLTIKFHGCVKSSSSSYSVSMAPSSGTRDMLLVWDRDRASDERRNDWIMLWSQFGDRGSWRWTSGRDSRRPCCDDLGIVAAACVTHTPHHTFYTVTTIRAPWNSPPPDIVSLSLKSKQASKLYMGWRDVTESMATIRSPFCGYNTA